jgi:hypothetical protein
MVVSESNLRITFGLAYSQNVFQGIQRHLGRLHVHHGEQVAERLDAALRDEVPGELISQGKGVNMATSSARRAHPIGIRCPGGAGGTYRICKSEPPEVALLMAHAASLRVLKSPSVRMRRRGGMMLASSTACSTMSCRDG